jgi:cytochrome c6
MHKTMIVMLAVAALAATSTTSFAKESKGEALFKKHCTVCHADGGNMINPAKTLSKKDRDANGVKNAKDIIGKMRKPGPGMTAFDAKTLPEKDARAIADYVLKTFK